MKKYWILALIFVGFFALQSCGSNKEGCPANQNVDVKMDRDGRLPTSGGKSNLFSKKMRKKM